MAAQLAAMTGYLLVLLAIGWRARRRAEPGIGDFFVASRSVSPWILFLTMAATNFSAFTVFGFAGAGWQSGYSFYPIIAFGTGFMALTFLWIGEPVRRIGQELGLITPPELMQHVTGSRAVQVLFFLVMTVFTLPYLAMQPMAAGYVLESMLGIPYFVGATVVTGILLGYTLLGGFRGVSWTDAFQGAMMLLLLLLAAAWVAQSLGGFTAAHHTLAETHPELLSRPGLDGYYTPGIWFGYLALWFLCDPLFPQLFQRFYAARSRPALATTMTMYPVLTAILFILPITIGVLGRISFPSLPEGSTPDQILPLMLSAHLPAWLEALVLTAALAALMSTLDSQLLTLSSMFVQDVWGPCRRWGARTMGRPPPTPPSMKMAKGFVVVLGLTGLAIAYRPPASFLVLATQTFSGLAVLFPALIAALYWSRTKAWAIVASILVGEGLVVADAMGVLPSSGTLAAVPIVAIASTILVLGSLLPIGREVSPRRGAATSERPRRHWIVLFAGLFLLGNDVWNWGNRSLWLLGYPRWVWWAFGLCLTTSLVLGLWARSMASPKR